MASVMTTKMVLNVQRRLVVIENENKSLLFSHIRAGIHVDIYYNIYC